MRWAARQRAQQNLPKSLRLYSAPLRLARQTLTPHFPAAVATLVLDSNVVLDWLVFRDPSSRGCAAAITSGRVVWVATSAMREELEHVLDSRQIRRLGSRSRRRSGSVRTLGAACRSRSAARSSASVRCSDPDDQKFIDLALHLGANALLSRDRAVLRLARSGAPASD